MLPLGAKVFCKHKSLKFHYITICCYFAFECKKYLMSFVTFSDLCVIYLCL